MPFDAVFLSAVAQELRQAAIGTRVDRVHQPQKDALILQLRSRDGAKKLLLSASPNHPRVHLTREAVENPAQPPMFCMLLRKHLVGGRVVEVLQPPMERLLEFVLDCTDEMGESGRRFLIIELMGRASNLILLDAERRIVDCLRRVDFEMSEKRQVLPGLFYQVPPAPDRENPATCQDLQARLAAVDGPKLLDKWILEQFAGLSPLIGRELAYGFCQDTDCDLFALSPERRQALAAYLEQEFAKLSGPYTPTMLLLDGKPKEFSYRPIAQYQDLCQTVEPESFSALLDRFYADRDRSERIRQKTQSVVKTITNLRDRTSRKLELQRKELEATRDRERLRQLGDIVTANLHAIARGQTRLTAVDFYDEQMKEIDIALSAQHSPQQNAAKFYKDYTKAKHAEQMLTGLIATGEQEREYLCSTLDALSRAEGEKDVQEIREELEAGGYLRNTDRKKKMKQAPSRPMEFRSSAGISIYVGRNNRQNDQLTLKTALKNELWLHTQKIHGSHVIIAHTDPDDQTVTEAAQLAAYYSQAREGQNIPVDCTQVRNVKKPAGSKPGMVIYDHYRTVYVTPDPELAQTLKV